MKGGSNKREGRRVGLTSEKGGKREDHHSFPTDSLRVDCVDGKEEKAWGE